MKTRTGNLFKRNGIYYVRWRVNKKLFMRSTGESELKKAKAKRDEILAPFLAGREVDMLRNVSARNEDRTAEIEQWEEKENSPLKLADAWRAYGKAVNRPDTGPSTLEQYGGHYKQFAQWMKKNHPSLTTMRDVSPAIAEEYAQHLNTRRVAAGTFNKLAEIPAAERGEYVLPDFATRYLREKGCVSKEIQKHFNDCGITTVKPGTGPGTGNRAVVEVGFHSLRHTFVSLCREANAPLAVVEAIVGHASPAMTRHYTHIGEAAAGAAVAALPDITGTAKAALPAGDTVTIPAATLRDLAERLTPENTEEIRSDLMRLAHVDGE